MGCTEKNDRKWWTVHFRGWDARFDEEIDADHAERFLPPYSVEDWRNNLSEGDEIEVRDRATTATRGPTGSRGASCPSPRTRSCEDAGPRSVGPAARRGRLSATPAHRGEARAHQREVGSPSTR